MVSSCEAMEDSEISIWLELEPAQLEIWNITKSHNLIKD